MIILLRILQALALVYNMWIIVRVLYEWSGWVLTILSILLMPLSVIAMPVAMFFFPSGEAGPFALWPGIIVIGTADGLIRKLKARRYASNG